MYKVLIADDELLVRIGLKTTIDWEENNFNVIGEARNGKEAIEMFNKEMPDILITDVSMPYINGLELIQVLKQKNEKLKSIILTHYDDFNYAQEAINLGVTGYLLKSNLTQENLLKYLKRAVEGLVLPTDERPLPVLHPKLKQLLQPDLLNTKELEEIKEKHFPHKIIIIATVVFHSKNSDPEFSTEGISNFNKVFTNISGQVFTGHYMKVFPLIIENKAIYFFNIPAESWDSDFNKRLANKMILLKNNIKKYLNLNISIGIGSSTQKMETLYKSYQNSLKAYKESFFEKTNIAFYVSAEDKDPIQPKKVNLSNLNRLVRQNDISGLDTFIEDFFNIQRQYKNTDYLHQSFRVLLKNAEDIFSHNNSERTSTLIHTKLKGDVINHFYNISFLQQYIFDIYHELINSESFHSEDIQNSYIIRRSINYIKKHYAKNISLLTVAQHVDVSRSYLSFLFKQELEVNFSAYMTGVRMEKARHLLLNSNMKIYEIAEKVGFDSPYYFSKVFKEKAGMSCMDFRNRYYITQTNPVSDD